MESVELHDNRHFADSKAPLTDPTYEGCAFTDFTRANPNYHTSFPFVLISGLPPLAAVYLRHNAISIL